MSRRKKQPSSRLFTPWIPLLLAVGCIVTGFAMPSDSGNSDTPGFQKPVYLPDIEDQQLVQIIIDDEIYAVCRPDFADVRLYDPESREIPRIIEVVAEPLKKEYSLQSVNITEDAVNRQTVIEVTTFRQPLTTFQLVTSSRNFNRSATIQTFGQNRWFTIGSYYLHNLSYQDIRAEQLRMHFPENLSGRYRILIQNGDNPPLKIDRVVAEGRIYRLIFLAQAKQGCRLMYGADSMMPPAYDTVAIRELTGKGFSAKSAQIGPGVRIEDHRPTSSKMLTILNSWWFFIAIVVLMVLTLGYILFRVAWKQDI